MFFSRIKLEKFGCNGFFLKSDKVFIYKTGFVLLFLLIVRLISMYVIPLNDSTEARYGEIARIMLETGNWVTPMQQYGVPFWAKPPLSSWLSAFSMGIFGVNEFSARLPSLILSIAILAMIFGVAKKRHGVNIALISVLVLASSIFFFLDAGTVMTDPALLFSTTLIFMAFWNAVALKSKIYSYLFFVALGLGLLSKGPIALVLTGIPIFIWVLKCNKWRDIWKNLPWIKGGLIMLVIAMPWYLLAESRTPGFLNYFIVGEHFNRFLQPGWTGDKYGFAHFAPYGTIWLYALLGITPWSILAMAWIITKRKKLPEFFKDDDNWLIYLIICTITPLIFFTFASNIIYPYVFPILPTFALLFTEICARSNMNSKFQQRILLFSLITGVLFLSASLLFVFKPILVEKSQKRVVKIFEEKRDSEDNKLIYWGLQPDFSARFYSAGQAIATTKRDELCSILENKGTNFVVVESKKIQQMPEDIVLQLEKLDSVFILKKEFSILVSNDVVC